MSLTYILPVAAMWMTSESSSVGDRFVGGRCGVAGRPVAANRPRAGRHDERLRHVQRAGDELFASAAGHGARRHAAGGILQVTMRKPSTLGPWRCSQPDGPSALGLGFERLVTIDILIYGCSLPLEFLALIFLRVREPESAA